MENPSEGKILYFIPMVSYVVCISKYKCSMFLSLYIEQMKVIRRQYYTSLMAQNIFQEHKFSLHIEK